LILEVLDCHVHTRLNILIIRYRAQLQTNISRKQAEKSHSTLKR